MSVAVVTAAHALALVLRFDLELPPELMTLLPISFPLLLAAKLAAF